MEQLALGILEKSKTKGLDFILITLSGVTGPWLINWNNFGWEKNSSKNEGLL